MELQYHPPHKLWGVDALTLVELNNNFYFIALLPHICLN